MLKKLLNWVVLRFVFLLLLVACAPQSYVKKIYQPNPFELEAEWAISWRPKQNTTSSQTTFKIVKIEPDKQSNNYFMITLKSGRPDYANATSDGFLSYNAAGAGTSYLFLVEPKGSKESIWCGFKDIQWDQSFIKGVVYLKDEPSDVDINPIFYFSLYKGDMSKVGECTLEKK